MLERIEAEEGDAPRSSWTGPRTRTTPRRLMGFGHRVYKNYDPRAAILKKTCTRRASSGSACRASCSRSRCSSRRSRSSDDYFVSRKLYPNVDFYSGIIYKALGIPVEHVHGDVRDRPHAGLDRAVARDAERPGHPHRAAAPGLHRRHAARVEAHGAARRQVGLRGRDEPARRSMPDILVVIPTRERRALLADALASVAAQEHLPQRVVVCDVGGHGPIDPPRELAGRLDASPEPRGDGRNPAQRGGGGGARGTDHVPG